MLRRAKKTIIQAAALLLLLAGQAAQALTIDDLYLPDGSRPAVMNNITALSGQFLGTPYRFHPLTGSQSVPERLVTDLNAIDCFTYLDVVEALRRSPDSHRFAESLIQIRYKNGRVDFTQRRHFFSDWVSGPHPVVRDITRQLSPAHNITRKQLNQRTAQTHYIPGIPVTQRDIAWLPVAALTPAVIAQLRTGDYIGIYSPQTGLDVTHAGIFIRTADGIWLRNASSKRSERKVIDSLLKSYLKQKAGIVVYRPLDVN